MTGIIVNVLNWLAGVITAHIPAITLDSGVLGNVSDAIAYVLDVVAKTNWIFPVPDALLIIGIVIGFTLVKVGIFVANWVIQRIFDVIP